MKPHLLKVPLRDDHSFSVRRDSVPYFYNHWHYHPELELIHIHKGTGTQFMGDNIRHFRPDDMILVGSGLPHMWRCDDAYFHKNSQLLSEATVVHFLPDFAGESFWALPENRNIRTLFLRAQQGIHILGGTRMIVAGMMEELHGSTGTKRLILLLGILSHLANSSEMSQISSMNWYMEGSGGQSDSIDRIYQYVLNHFHRPISLREVASVAGISPKAFCRFFKQRTRKTFSSFLSELRVGHACKLLLESDLSVASICYESGFNNGSNFNRQFLKIKGLTPRAFRNKRNA